VLSPPAPPIVVPPVEQLQLACTPPDAVDSELLPFKLGGVGIPGEPDPPEEPVAPFPAMIATRVNVTAAALVAIAAMLEAPAEPAS
jgi:hypothetical protein